MINPQTHEEAIVLEDLFRKQYANKFSQENVPDITCIWKISEVFRILDLTAFLAINIFLRLPLGIKGNKNLVAPVCLLIANKYEEEESISVENLRKILIKYTAAEIVEMEINILSAINYKIETPTPLSFLHIFAKSMDFSKKEYILARYICVLASFSGGLLPSVIAASSLYISRAVLVNIETEWDENIQKLTKSNLETIIKCAKTLYKIHTLNSHNFNQCVGKYTKRKYMEVGSIIF